MGLPYADDPAITQAPRGVPRGRCTAAPAVGLDLDRRPRRDAVLFNGGFFTPAIARERVLENLAQLVRRRRGVAAARAREREPGGRRGAGRSARTPLPGVAADCGCAPAARAATTSASGGEDAGRAVCILPRGTEEGSTLQPCRSRLRGHDQPAGLVPPLQQHDPCRCARRDRCGRGRGTPRARAAVVGPPLREEDAAGRPGGRPGCDVHRNRNAAGRVHVAQHGSPLAPAVLRPRIGHDPPCRQIGL